MQMRCYIEIMLVRESKAIIEGIVKKSVCTIFRQQYLYDFIKRLSLFNFVTKFIRLLSLF